MISVDFSPDGTSVVSRSRDMQVRVWVAGGTMWVSKGHSDWVRCIAFSYLRSRIASGSWVRTVQIWSVDTADCSSA